MRHKDRERERERERLIELYQQQCGPEDGKKSLYAVDPADADLASLRLTPLIFGLERSMCRTLEMGPRLPARAPCAPISQGSAAAEDVKTFKTVKAMMGERSSVPPSGGMMPRKRFRYGSVTVLFMRSTRGRRSTHERPNSNFVNSGVSQSKRPSGILARMRPTRARIPSAARVKGGRCKQSRPHLRGCTIDCGAFGNQVDTSRTTRTVL